MQEISFSEITELSQRFLTHKWFDSVSAESIIQHLLEAELCGKSTHWFARLPLIHDRIVQWKIVPQQEIVTNHEWSTVTVTWNQTLWIPAIIKWLDVSLWVAKEHSVAIGVVQHVWLTGYLWHYARIACDNDMIFLGWSNTWTTTVAWTWWNSPILWTNPMVVGIPSIGYPCILDMSTSWISNGEVTKQKVYSWSLPVWTAISATGEETINPHDVFALLPFGWHKWAGLSLAIELLVWGLTDTKLTDNVEPWQGFVYLLIDPKKFSTDLHQFKERIAAYLKTLKNTSEKELFYPGERSWMQREKMLEQWKMPVSSELYEFLNSL